MASEQSWALGAIDSDGQFVPLKWCKSRKARDAWMRDDISANRKAYQEVWTIGGTQRGQPFAAGPVETNSGELAS
jgi:hypothetical protein